MTRIAIGIRVIRGKSLVAAYTALWFLCIRNRNSEMQYLGRLQREFVLVRVLTVAAVYFLRLRATARSLKK